MSMDLNFFQKFALQASLILGWHGLPNRCSTDSGSGADFAPFHENAESQNSNEALSPDDFDDSDKKDYVVFRVFQVFQCSDLFLLLSGILKSCKDPDSDSSSSSSSESGALQLSKRIDPSTGEELRAHIHILDNSILHTYTYTHIYIYYIYCDTVNIYIYIIYVLYIHLQLYSIYTQ